ncbi:MAG: prepilin-type N-terminal cleavage/methylation domain-containing protein [Deltaproteobacteria bacterium]|nr:prepilin-type N-terminal cleavage/methylation domain-containing protein [Candidatus Anaeroferrophillacea bacterium]
MKPLDGRTDMLPHPRYTPDRGRRTGSPGRGSDRRRRRVGGFTLVETVIFIVIMSVAAAGVMAVYFQTLRRGAAPLVRQKAVVLAADLMDEILSRAWDERTPVGGGGLDACAGGVKDTRNDDGNCGNAVDGDALVPGSDDDDASPIGRDAGESAGGSRASWDDIDDYDGLVENNANADAGDDLRDQSGGLIAGVPGMVRAATVEYVGLAGAGSAADPYGLTLAGDGRGGGDPDTACGGSSRTNFKRVTVTVTTMAGEDIRLVSVRGNF